MPKVKHIILRWAREVAKLSIKTAAHKLNLKDSKSASAEEKLAAFERGEKVPSRSLILRMSRQYHMPLLTFYLDKPPVKGDRGEDFRTLPDPDDFEEIENTYVDVLIRDLKARQNTVRETLIDADEKVHLNFIGKYTIDHGVDKIIKTIRNELNIDLDEYRRQPSHKEAFRFLRHKVEMAGIFVLLEGNLGSYHSNITVATFRGFALSDDIAPFIVINDQDAESAWSFTLLHEVVHLILGQTGISGAYGEKQIEKFCNNVASEIILPASEFYQFQLSSLELEAMQSEISDYAFSKKLSSSHIAYRLYRRGDIDLSSWKILHEYYHKNWRENQQAVRYKNKQKKGGPGYYIVKRHKLGELVKLIQRLTYSGSLTTTKAGMVLDVKPLKLHRLFQDDQFT